MRRAVLLPSLATARMLIVVFLSQGLVAGAESGSQEPLHFAADRPVDCLHIRLELDVDVAERRVDGRALIDLVALRELSSVTLDAVELETSAVTVSPPGGRPLPANHVNDGKHLTVLLRDRLRAGDKVRLAVEYTVQNPTRGLHFFGPTAEEPDVPYVVWSQGESTCNSYWFPCFDHPNERQTTELVVTAKQGYQVSSNGRLVSREENPDKNTVVFHWRQDRPHVAYLVSLIVGDFHIVRDTWRGKPVEYWVHRPYAKHVRRTFRNTTRMLDFFTDAIGVDYPWDRYAQICCEGFGGGMENTSATTLGSRALHDERSLLDSNSDGLIAHELAHQWWGDLLTCRDWAHLWLNEGFATYFEALWTEHDLGAEEFAYNMYRKGQSARRGVKSRPIVDRAYDRPGAMFDSRAYPKGAWVLHMLRRRLGDDLFWKVINHYAEDHAFENVETVDLRKTVERVTGRALERFFYDWTQRPGHPEVTVSFTWLSDDGLARVRIRQTQEAPAFHFPLTLEFRCRSNRSPVTLTRHITEKDISFYYPLEEAPALVRVDPDQAVLMELKENKGRDLWRAQLLDDPSPVARIRAARHLGESQTEADHRLLAAALAKESFWGVRREISQALRNIGGDVARDALIAGLRFRDHKARHACAEALGAFHRDSLAIEAIKPLVTKGDLSYRVEAAAIRIYAELEPPDALDVLQTTLGRESRFEVIRNAALAALGDLPDPGAVDVLCEWTRPDKPRFCRPEAIRALGRITRRAVLDEETIGRIVATLTAQLESTGTRIRLAAVRALGTLSEPARAKPALPVLRGLATNDPSRRVRTAVTRTIEAIEAGKPVPVQVAELRAELKDALERNEDLADRVEKLEAQLEKRGEHRPASAEQRRQRL